MLPHRRDPWSEPYGNLVWRGSGTRGWPVCSECRNYQLPPETCLSHNSWCTDSPLKHESINKYSWCMNSIEYIVPSNMTEINLILSQNKYLPSFSKFLKMYPSVAFSSWAVLSKFLETSKWTSRLFTIGLANIEFTGASWPIKWNETINLGSSTSSTLIRLPLLRGSRGSWKKWKLKLF